jgi:hypothetical protein
MTYQELIDLYMRSGGMAPRAPSYAPTGEGGSFTYDPGGSQAVQLPDGRTAMVNADGTITISQLNDGRDRETVTRMTPDGQATTEEREYDRNANFRRSLAGAIGVGVGGPLLGGLASAYLGGAGGLTAAELAAIGGSEAAAQAGSAALAGGAGTAAGGGLTAAELAAIGGSETAAQAGSAALAGGTVVPPAAPAPPAPPTAAGAGMLGSIGSALAGNPALAGATLGAIAGAAGSRPESQTQTNTQSLPPWLQPYAESFLRRADALSQQPFQEYTGPGVAPMTPDQTLAIDQARHLAVNGDPLVGRARDQQSALLAGQMLGPNQFLDRYAQGIGDRMGEAYATGTRAGLMGRQAMGGGTLNNSSAFGQTLQNSDRAFGDALGQTMNQLYYGNFRDERNAQDAAARSSLGFAADQRANTQGLLSAGMLQQQQQQNVNNYQRSEFDRRQQYPYQQLDVLRGAINPAFGGQSSATRTDPGVSPWQGALGGALSGWAIGNNLFGGQQQNSTTQGPTQPQARPFTDYWNWRPQ